MAWSGERFSDFQGNNMNNNSSNRFQQRNKPQQFQSRSNQHNGYMKPQSNLPNGYMKLANLNTGSSASVIGMVIAKEGPKSIFSKKGNGTERFLFSFVLRDSPHHFVNCTVWGKELYITETSRLFCIGDVVNITNAQVQSKPTDGSEEKFRVATPVPFTLSLSENHSSVTLYDGMDLGTYSPLQYIPTKPNSDYYTLEDVQTNGEALTREHINLLAAVRKICPSKDIKTKTGKQTKRCEVRLFDDTCNSFSLILWGEELVNFVQSWIPVDTVVFAADVRMNFDDFKSCMVATADSKTVLTLNPDTVNARCLAQFAQTQQFPEDEMSGERRDKEDPPLEQIQEVATVQQTNTREGLSSDYAVVYAVLTQFDIDTENTDLFYKRKCSKCKQLVFKNTGYQCTNTDCSQGALSMFNTTGEVTAGEPELDFSLPVSLADHTGSITARLGQQQMEALTGWNVNALMQLDAAQRTQIKWNHLMERCKFYIKMIKNFKEPDRQFVRVLSCCKADPHELSQAFNSMKGR